MEQPVVAVEAGLVEQLRLTFYQVHKTLWYMYSRLLTMVWRYNGLYLLMEILLNY